MATLILTAVGTAIGGPIGGAIGAALGQQVDRSLFAPKAREGPRLKELEVQTSSYGTAIPAIFGTMRVAGTIIWATDLIERRVKSGGGKGRPSTADYSYSVSMAVALSSRPLLRIGRIWADGNLLRGAAGDFKSNTQFRFYGGQPDQAVDPLIASAEASGQCPAHRGIAYAVFEDFQLADYGNRIPSLTFEIFEREEACPVSEIFSVLSQGKIVGNSGETINGYAATGADARAGLAPLLAVLPVDAGTRDGRLEISDRWSFAGYARTIDPVRSENGRSFDPPEQSLQPPGSAAQSLALRYYDPARDFQTSVQRAENIAAGRASAQIEFPAVLDSDSAQRLVELKLSDIQLGRDGWRGQAIYGQSRLQVGDWVADDRGKKRRITEIEHYQGSMTLIAQGSIMAGAGQPVSSSPGRNVPAPDLLVGETRIDLVDLPIFGAIDPGEAQVAIFASGSAVGWRSAALSVRKGDDLIELGATAVAATAGVAISGMPAHNPNLIDDDDVLEVQMAHSGMDIVIGNGSPLSQSAPVCQLGDELVRFGTATALGNNRFRLSGLQRGCFGTGQIHLAGERFVLLEADTARIVGDAHAEAGSTLGVEAIGLGDGEPVDASILVQPRATMPLPPVHGSAAFLDDGDLHVAWIRRSRIDLGWRDGIDQLLGEDSERYAISLMVDGEPVSERVAAEPVLVFSAAEIAALQMPSAANLAIAVRQIGKHRQSLPLMIPVYLSS